MKPLKNLEFDFEKEEDFDAEFATNSLIMDEEYFKDHKVMEEIQVMEAKVEVDENHK